MSAWVVGRCGWTQCGAGSGSRWAAGRRNWRGWRRRLLVFGQQQRHRKMQGNRRLQHERMWRRCGCGLKRRLGRKSRGWLRRLRSCSVPTTIKGERPTLRCPVLEAMWIGSTRLWHGWRRGWQMLRQGQMWSRVLCRCGVESYADVEPSLRRMWSRVLCRCGVESKAEAGL